MRDSSVPTPRVSVLLRRTVEYFHQYGLNKTSRRIVCFVARQVDALLNKQPARTKAQVPEQVLDLQPGELVEVRSEEDIRRTLDSSSRTRGLGFMAGMARHCGKRYRVYKQVRTIILESSGEVRRLKNTVLLEGVICDGEHFVCDRSCFYFWKEAWLQRVSSVDGPSANANCENSVKEQRTDRCANSLKQPLKTE
jgi:hypothetical protein